jgi:hypothetical protein
MTDALGQSDGESPALSSPVEQVLQQANQSLISIEQVKADAMQFVQGIEKVRSSCDSALQQIQQYEISIKSAAENAASNDQEIGTLLAAVKKQAEHIEAVYNKADELLEGINKSVSSGESALEAVQAALVLAQEAKTKSQDQLEQCANAKVEAEAAAALLKGLSDKAQTVEKRIADYEARLGELENQSKEQLKTIVGLLPGATSAGLAAAFDERRKSFLSPTKKWQWLFVGSVILLVVLAGSGMYHLYEDGRVLGYDELLRLWLGRAPVAAALVWLAIHASRESALAKRLEEDYGYKAAVAASFQGFQMQMAEIEERAGNDSPLTRLCADTLATIGSPPGRIYERHRLTATPTDEVKDVVKTLADKIPFGGNTTRQEGK